MAASVSFLANPGLADAKRAVETAVAQHALIVVLGRCRVSYEGRGASRLGPGDRLVIVKPDGAVLVHRPTGYSPVNWQPESHAITLQLTEEGLVLRSVRRRPREVLVVVFEKVYMIVTARSLVDEAEFIEYLDEKEISDYLAAHPDTIEEGLKVLARERRIGDGYADIVALDREGRYVIVEVKRVTAGQEAVKQLNSYVSFYRRANPGAAVRGILVAPSITKDAYALLQSLGLEYHQIDLAKLYREIRRAGKTSASGHRSLLDFLGG